MPKKNDAVDATSIDTSQLIKPKKRSRRARQGETEQAAPEITSAPKAPKAQAPKAQAEIETKPVKPRRNRDDRAPARKNDAGDQNADQRDDQGEDGKPRRRRRRRSSEGESSEPRRDSRRKKKTDADTYDQPADDRADDRNPERDDMPEEDRESRGENGDSEDKPRRRRRGGRNRNRSRKRTAREAENTENTENATDPTPDADEVTGVQSRDPDESNETAREEEPDTPRRPRREPRRRSDRGEPRSERRDRDDASSGREDRRSDNRSESRPDNRDEPVVFDADAEFDPDVFADKTYDQLPIRKSVLRGIHAAGFNRPTHIQDQLIPIALESKDVLGQAKTGTGKTAAFSIPVLCQAERGVPFQTLILAPTRELAIQISAEITALGECTPIKCAAVYGGQPIPIQKKKLEQGPEIIVATPGRLMDMYEHRNLHFKNVRQVILDEVDRMLDIGFRDDIKKILGQIKTDHQTIFVSATISDEIEKLAKNFMDDPERLTLAAGALTVQLVDQTYVPCEPWYKRRLLLHLLTHEEPALTVVFCRTKATVDRAAQYLKDKGVDALAIHGDMPQGKRNAVMKKLRGGQLSVLVASDLAARGLDVDDISHVINYDLPDDPEVYVHRIGRTARAGKRGHAWSFVLPDQGELLTQIEMLTNVQLERLEYADFDPGEPPADIREEHKKREQSKARAEKMVSRLTGPAVPNKAAENDPRFPGGVVPTKLPPKMPRGKVNTARGMKQLRAAELKDAKVED